jgi:hypothetical protein
VMWVRYGERTCSDEVKWQSERRRRRTKRERGCA